MQSVKPSSGTRHAPVPRGDTGGNYGGDIRLRQMRCPPLAPCDHAVSGSKLATGKRVHVQTDAEPQAGGGLHTSV
jgi:hypothetical protein